MRGTAVKGRRRPVLTAAALAAAALAATVLLLLFAVLLESPGESAPATPGPLFTSVAYAQSAAQAPAKVDIRKCIITLAYAEFIVDGNYHTPKVVVTYQGRKLRKNKDYTIIFYGGRDAGTSTVKIMGTGAYTGEVTKTYTGIETTTTTVKKTKAPRSTRPSKASTAAKTTSASKPAAKTSNKSKPAAKTSTKSKPAAKKDAAERPEKTEAADKSKPAEKQTKPATKEQQTKKTKPGKKERRTKPGKSVKPVKPVKQVRPKASQKIASISTYTFSERGKVKKVGAKVSSGLKLQYRSSAPEVVSVSSSGMMKAKKAGTAKITIRQKGNNRFNAVSRTIIAVVPEFRSREEALTSWRHVLIDTFFQINSRKYSREDPGKYWRKSNGKWSGKTGENGNTQSCVTLSTVALKRMGLIPPGSGCIWLSSNHGKSPNKTVKRLKRNSNRLAISYPHRSLRYLVRNDMVRYGDILCRSGHTFVYMGTDSGGHPLIYECGARRDIGGGTCVVWGHHSGGHADKLTGKINKQIKKSKKAGVKWRRGQLKDDDFKGHRASGKNLNKPIRIICSIRTFKVRTSCTNGSITLSNTYMAGRNVTIRFAPAKGKTIGSVKVDGKKVRAKSRYTFRRISADHTITVTFRQKKQRG